MCVASWGRGCGPASQDDGLELVWKSRMLCECACSGPCCTRNPFVDEGLSYTNYRLIKSSSFSIHSHTLTDSQTHPQGPIRFDLAVAALWCGPKHSQSHIETHAHAAAIPWSTHIARYCCGIKDMRAANAQHTRARNLTSQWRPENPTAAPYEVTCGPLGVRRRGERHFRVRAFECEVTSRWR